MKSYLLHQYGKLLEQGLLYPIRLYLTLLGGLLFSLWMSSALESLIDLGELKVQWNANWLYETALILWVLYMILITVVGKFSTKD